MKDRYFCYRNIYTNKLITPVDIRVILHVEETEWCIITEKSEMEFVHKVKLQHPNYFQKFMLLPVNLFGILARGCRNAFGEITPLERYLMQKYYILTVAVLENKEYYD